MTGRWSILHLFIALLLCCAYLPFAGLNANVNGDELRPVALSFGGSGDLFVLDASGKVLVLRPSGQTAARRLLATFPGSWQPSDLTVGAPDDRDHIFVVLTQGNLSQIMQYSTEGQFENSWFQIGPLSGICTDKSSVYAASWSTGFVYRQPFSAPPKLSPKPFYRFLNMRSIGSLAWDPVGKVLFAADLQAGSIVALDVESMESRSVGEGLGQITALGFDSDGRKLYVVDSAGRTVWSINTAIKNAKAVKVLKAEEFRIPSAIAVGKDGSLWVGDPEAHAVFQFSLKGQGSKPLRIVR